MGRGVRSRARRQERPRARADSRQRPDHHRGLLDLRRALRAREDGARDPRPLRALLRRAGLRAPDDGHGADRPERRRAARVQDRRRLPDPADRHGAAVARDRRRRRPLGRGQPRDLRRDAERRDQADARRLRRVLRGRARRPARRRDGARGTSCGFEGLPRPRLQARTRHGPFDRDDDDRVAEDRRGRRDPAPRRHGVLHAPACDLAGRPIVSLHAGHVARHRGRRRAARSARHEDLRRIGGADMNELAKPVLPGSAGSDYERYLRTEELLALQKTADEWVHRDELLFQSVHQTSEIWLKLAWNEVEEAARLVGEDDFAAALRLLRRANDCFKLVTLALDMLEHMSPWEYTEVRKVLGHGSGFDSPGFKELRRVAKLLGEQFHAAHERAGLSLVEVYTQGREHEDLYNLAEQCIELDERVTVWRVRHFKVVQRTIGGDVIGTQGTPVEVMGRLIHHSFFPELWDVRNELTRMNLPE